MRGAHPCGRTPLRMGALRGRCDVNLDHRAKITWSSSTGFLLATVGSSIGLGNIWRFSYLADENGGGAFILMYVMAVGRPGVCQNGTRET
jgi:hypothetical protein